jgi:hypothetical protein
VVPSLRTAKLLNGDQDSGCNGVAIGAVEPVVAHRRAAGDRDVEDVQSRTDQYGHHAHLCSSQKAGRRHGKRTVLRRGSVYQGRRRQAEACGPYGYRLSAGALPKAQFVKRGCIVMFTVADAAGDSYSAIGAGVPGSLFSGAGSNPGTGTTGGSGTTTSSSGTTRTTTPFTTTEVGQLLGGLNKTAPFASPGNLFFDGSGNIRGTLTPQGGLTTRTFGRSSSGWLALPALILSQAYCAGSIFSSAPTSWSVSA